MGNQKIIFFLGEEEENGELSNWYRCQFKDQTDVDPKTKLPRTYRNVEQYMMKHKAELFNDNECAEKIMQTDDPAEIKALGRAVKNFEETLWVSKAQEIVYKGTLLKFQQNQKLREFLLKTGDSFIAEDSPTDLRWGIGYRRTDSQAQDPSLWRGENWLGKVLMRVREQVK